MNIYNTFISEISIIIAFVLVAAAPGPATIGNAFIAMRKGKMAGIHNGIGLAIGLAFWGVVAATGLGFILQSSVLMLTIIKISGGMYLVWLAYKTLTSRQAESKTDEDEVNSNYFLQGLLLNMSNPKAVLAWMAALSIGAETTTNTFNLIMLTAICSIIGLLIYVAYSLLFSLPLVMKAYVLFRRGIDVTVAAMFTIAGVALIRSAFVSRI